MCGGIGEKLVTDVEVARRLGTSLEHVGQLMARGDFPAPLGHMDSGSVRSRNVPFWRWTDVNAWACETGHAVPSRP